MALEPLRSKCRRLDFYMIFRSGLVHLSFSVSHRMPIHSRSEGRYRFSGLAVHSAVRSFSFSSARPFQVSFCLRVRHSRSDVTG